MSKTAIKKSGRKVPKKRKKKTPAMASVKSREDGTWSVQYHHIDKTALQKSGSSHRGSDMVSKKACTARDDHANKMPSGYHQSGPLILPKGTTVLVKPGKLHAGISAAKKQIQKSIQEIAEIMTQDYKVSEIEFSVSFDAQGKFMGFGVGGAATITVKIRPSSD